MILPAAPADLDALFYIEQANSAYPYTREIMDSLLNNAANFKAVDGEKIMGFVTTELVFSDGEITNIVVDSDYRGKGVGDELLTHAINDLIERGASRVLLEVAEDNIPAISLYKKHGFKQIAKRENYYHDKTALIMVRD